MKINLSLYALISAAVAVCCWALVFYAASAIQADAQNAAIEYGSAQATSDQQAALLKTHALAKTIAPQKQALETMLESDPLSLVTMMARAGQDAGVPLRVSDAIPENGSGSNLNLQGAATGDPNVPKLSAVGFTVQADGGFAALTRAALLLEVLPVPSMIEQLDISHPTGAAASSWHMNAHVRILTSSNFSS